MRFGWRVTKQQQKKYIIRDWYDWMKVYQSFHSIIKWSIKYFLSADKRKIKNKKNNRNDDLFISK